MQTYSALIHFLSIQKTKKSWGSVYDFGLGALFLHVKLLRRVTYGVPTACKELIGKTLSKWVQDNIEYGITRGPSEALGERRGCFILTDLDPCSKPISPQRSDFFFFKCKSISSSRGAFPTEFNSWFSPCLLREFFKFLFRFLPH